MVWYNNNRKRDNNKYLGGNKNEKKQIQDSQMNMQRRMGM